MLRDLLILRANLLLGRWEIPAAATKEKEAGKGKEKANGKAR